MSNTAIAVNVIDKSIDVIRTGGEILAANQIRKNKALDVGENILQQIAAGGMTPEVDTRANNFLANCRKAKDEMNEPRKPVTQILDAIKSEFTGVENALDVTKPDTIPYKIQLHRNEYAKQVKAENERKQKDADDLANRNKEKVSIKAELETSLSNYLNDCLLAKKTSITNAFNNITLENYTEKSEGLKNMEVKFPIGLLNEFKPDISARYLTPEDARTIKDEVCGAYRANETTSEFATKYVTEVTELKNQLIDRLASKKSELEELAKANDEEKKRLQQEADDREAEAARKLKEANEKAKQEAAQTIELNKVAGEAEVLFNKEASMITDGMAPEVRSGYNIVVKHSIGYTQIFQLWFEKEGKNLPIDKIGNTKLDQMKTWCEKLAFKTGEKIDSTYIEYVDVVKAVNKKQ